MVCLILSFGEKTLGKIEEEIYLDNIHYRYNFIIQPVENYETITIDGLGTRADYTYPETLDYTLQESITISYLMPLPFSYNLIKINPDAPSYLECENLIDMKKCVVPLSHFADKKAGYYYTHYLNNLDEYSIFYDLDPIQVILPRDNEIKIRILPEDNKNTIELGQKGTLYFVTNYTDEDNIFNVTDIEDKFSFPASIKEKQGNKYDVTCRFFSPINDNVRIFCWLNENLKQNDKYILLNNVSLFYGPYNIFILSETYRNNSS
jgi:hypothetical protein